jgi:two-component system chemotaxis response regulator CheB
MIAEFTPMHPDRTSQMIRVLVVEDSPSVRVMLVNMLESDPDIKIIGIAENGHDAVHMASRLKPDLITMDIRMPLMDGLEATRQIMSIKPVPIVVIANGIYTPDLNIAFNAIQAGALTVVEKPRGLDSASYEAVRSQLVTTVRSMSQVHVIRREHKLKTLLGTRPLKALHQTLYKRQIQVIAIGASTGGPGVLNQIFHELPQNFSIPILVVQHITPGFIEHLVEWLQSETKISIKVAVDGEKIAPGKVIVAPESTHLTVIPGGTIRLEYGPAIKGYRPSVSHLFETVGNVYGPLSVGVVLTGMGDDGTEGLEVLSRSGGFTIAQDEASCAVKSMPKTAVDRGIIDEVLDPGEITIRLLELNSIVARVHLK